MDSAPLFSSPTSRVSCSVDKRVGAPVRLPSSKAVAPFWRYFFRVRLTQGWVNRTADAAERLSYCHLVPFCLAQFDTASTQGFIVTLFVACHYKQVTNIT